MAKARVQFLCNSCGSVHPKWMGKCPDCGTWDSLEEYKAPTADARRAVSLHIYSLPYDRCLVYSLENNRYGEVELQYSTRFGKRAL